MHKVTKSSECVFNFQTSTWVKNLGKSFLGKLRKLLWNGVPISIQHPTNVRIYLFIFYLFYYVFDNFTVHFTFANLTRRILFE